MDIKRVDLPTRNDDFNRYVNVYQRDPEGRSINYQISLVGGIPTPLKNMSSSVGTMTFPIYGKNVPNHQLEI